MGIVGATKTYYFIPTQHLSVFPTYPIFFKNVMRKVNTSIFFSLTKSGNLHVYLLLLSFEY